MPKLRHRTAGFDQLLCATTILDPRLIDHFADRLQVFLLNPLGRAHLNSP